MPAPPAEKKVDELPANFKFTRDDPFYYGPATCNLVHYTPAAYAAGFIETMMLGGGSLWFWQLHSVNQSMDSWAVMCMFALTAGGVLTTLLMVSSCQFFSDIHSLSPEMLTLRLIAIETDTLTMFYGIKTEQARLISPKLAFIQLEITLLMLMAAVAIVAMSFGISVTHQLFSVFVRNVSMSMLKLLFYAFFLLWLLTIILDIEISPLIPEMERDFGPIWPFNIGVICFFAAALCIWIRVLISGAMEFILDKQFFTEAPPIEMEKTLPQRE